MSSRFIIHKGRLAFLLTLLLLIPIYFGWALLDPPVKTEQQTVHLIDGVYYNNLYKPHKGATLRISINSPSSVSDKILVAFIQQPYEPTFNLSEYKISHPNLSNRNQQLTTTTAAMYTFEYSYTYRVVIYSGTSSSPSSLNIQIKFDQTPYSYTDEFVLATFFLVLIVTTMFLLLHKDLQYLWRMIRARFLGKELKTHEYATSADKLDALFSKRNTQDFQDTSKKNI